MLRKFNKIFLFTTAFDLLWMSQKPKLMVLPRVMSKNKHYTMKEESNDAYTLRFINTHTFCEIAKIKK